MRYLRNTFSNALCKKLKSLQKILKNAEKSHDLDHIRTVIPNKAKLEIFAKHLWKASKKIENLQKS